jgi:hypothetical protein
MKCLSAAAAAGVLLNPCGVCRAELSNAAAIAAACTLSPFSWPLVADWRQGWLNDALMTSTSTAAVLAPTSPPAPPPMLLALEHVAQIVCCRDLFKVSAVLEQLRQGSVTGIYCALGVRRAVAAAWPGA